MRIIFCIFLVFALAIPMFAGENPDNDPQITQQETSEAQTTSNEPVNTDSFKTKRFFWGFKLGLGMEQPLVPDEFNQGAYKAKSKPMFAFDIGVYINYYFLKWLGVNCMVGYDYLPFHLDGEGEIPGSTQTITAPIPGFPLPQYNKFTGYLKGAMHYLYIMLGPTFKINRFFINLDFFLIIHLASKYKISVGSFVGAFAGIKMPEISGDYKKARPAALGISLEPGYRIRLSDSLSLPISLAFRIMLTPIAETNIEGFNLPKANIYTWYLKLKAGIEF